MRLLETVHLLDKYFLNIHITVQTSIRTFYID